MPKVVPQYTDDAKRRIIRAAMEAMAESGYENVAVDDVARRIGVTKGAVYWYFKSKSALIQEVLVTMENRLYVFASDPIFNQPDKREVPPAFDRISFSEESRKSLLSEIGLLDSVGDDIPEVTPESVRELVYVLEKAIEREQKSGHIRSLSDTKTLALALAVLCCGVQKGETYSVLFLGQSKVRRIWFYAMKLFLNSST